MSIQYAFTPYGTIHIRCGSEWIEVKLPGGGDPGGSRPDPAATPAPGPVASPSPPPPPAPEPATTPGVMFIESSTYQPFDARDLFRGQLGDVVRWNLTEFKDLPPEVLRAVLRQRVTRVTPRRFGGITVLDVDVGSLPPLDATHGLSNLQRLLKEERDLGLDVLRFWRNDTLE